MPIKVIDYPPLNIHPLNDKAGDVLKELVDKIGIDYWLSAGTALGLYRDKDFPVGDTDIDIAVMYFDGIYDYLIEKLEGFRLARITDYDGDLMQMVFIKDENIVDIMINRLEDGKCYYYHDMGYMEAIIDTPVDIETKYGTYKIPGNIEDYLKQRYGDWKIPTKEKSKFV